MPVACLGISHRTAPVALRERFALSPEAQRLRLASFDRDALRARHGIGELAILSTCNRTEVYAGAAEVLAPFCEVPPVLLDLLVDGRPVARERLDRHVYRHRGAEAVRHLSRVAAGLESMVFGEAEILGQVTAAYRIAREAGTVGAVLEASFRAAVRAGRRARAETGIGRLSLSVASEAVRTAREMRGDLAACDVLVVGTGKVGALAGEQLRERGVRRLGVVSRTTLHAERLAGPWGARAIPWIDLVEAISEADLVLCSTGAPHAVVTTELVRRALASRAGGRPLLFLDLAVPRDVEPEVARLPGVEVVDLDGLRARLGQNLALRRREEPRVEAVVEEEVLGFLAWLRAAALRPVLSAIHGWGEEVRRREVDRLLRRLGDLPPGIAEKVEQFSQLLVSKLLRVPSQRLRTEDDSRRREAYAEAARYLFGLPEGGNGGPSSLGVA